MIGLDHGVVGRGGLQFVDGQDAVIASRIAGPVAEVALHRLNLLQNRPVGVRPNAPSVSLPPCFQTLSENWKW